MAIVSFFLGMGAAIIIQLIMCRIGIKRYSMDEINRANIHVANKIAGDIIREKENSQ